MTFHKHDVRLSLTNKGACPVTISSISISWPAANGKLKEVELDGHEIFDHDRMPTSTVINSGWKGSASKRTIKAGHTEVLEFEFDKTASTKASLYTIQVQFAEGCTVKYPAGPIAAGSTEEVLLEGAQPTEFALFQNYPNPFNPSTNIGFTVPQSGFATMKVYNVLGQEVATLFEGNADA
ncbi:MAG: hypothetical protein AAB393_18045, partial [Bacteroidota bacterium]